jgi:hypothetical protein
VNAEGLPIVDARAWIAAIDWSKVPSPRADDVGIGTDDGRWLRTEGEILDWFAQDRSEG